MWQASIWCCASAFSWALYSVNAAYWSREFQTKTAAPLFTIACGVCLLGLRSVPAFAEPMTGPLDADLFVNMLYSTLVLVVGCKIAWDYACSRGNIIVITCAAYFGPILATFWNVTLLGVDFQDNMAYGSMGIALAAVAAKYSLRD
eukprot:TRINITY_DN18835_c0_g1_i3.p1 TRINITY_DN18835_c0_g1~~TRINITY_DN18835_c0_g1_i3.p1  ORF type:complete len:146 (-),score=13.14 TRINITY_DN18835_c0_g1_i3:542-979(-)